MKNKLIGNRGKGRLEELMKKAADDPIVNEIVEGKKDSQEIIPARYGILRADDYCEGVRKLQNDSQSSQPNIQTSGGFLVYRPLSIKETIRARVEDYNILKNPDGSKRTKQERLRLFDTYLDTCTGAAFKKESRKFKIMPVCVQLLTNSEDVSEIPIVYESLDGIELDADKINFNEPLRKDEVLNHPGWRALVDDNHLLKTYVDLFSKLNPNLWGFLSFELIYELSDMKNELSSVYIHNMKEASHVQAGSDLSEEVCFVLRK